MIALERVLRDLVGVLGCALIVVGLLELVPLYLLVGSAMLVIRAKLPPP